MYAHTALLIFFLSFLCSSCEIKSDNDNFTWQSLTSKSSLLQKTFVNKDSFELQIRYTQIDRDELNAPGFTSYDFNLDTSLYFYPASTVKMPVAFLALQRMNELKRNVPDLSMSTTMLTDSIRKAQSPATVDSTSATGFPNIADYIKKLFVVSDNDSYNRLYEFLGQDYINQELRKKQVFSNSRIVTRVGVQGYTTFENRFTNPTRFVDNEGETFLLQEGKQARGNYIKPIRKAFKGKGYYDDDLDTIIMKPFNMYEKNFINLIDLEASLKRVIFPKAFPDSMRYNLTDSDYHFLYKSMSAYPKDYSFYANDDELNYDGYVKFFLFGNTKDPIPDHIHIFNKVGFAYGYLTDCAYIFDTKNNIEFFLTATIHVNDNRIYNDGKYEYDEVGIPFLAELGKQLYQLELTRYREHPADLLKFNVLD